MTFSVTFTANSLSELRSLLDKLEGRVEQKEETSLKPKVAIAPVKENEDQKVEKVPTFIGRSKKEKVVEKEAEPEKKGLQYIDVKKATVALATENADKVREVLSEFGVATATALKEAQWQEYVDRLGEELGKLKTDGELA